MTVIPFPPRQPPVPPRRQMDRAAVTAVAVFQIVGDALCIRFREGDSSAIDFARFAVEELLRTEFGDAKREVLNEIRLHDE